MFSFLKDKLKKVISSISKNVEEEPQKEPKTKKKEKAGEKSEAKEEVIEEIKEAEELVPEKKGFFAKLKEKFAVKEEEVKPVEKLEELKEEVKPESEKIEVEVEEEKKGIFGLIKEKVTTTKISEDKFEELFSELEMTLLENNVALEVIDKIKEDLKKNIVDKPIKRGKVEDEITSGLRESIEDLFLTPKVNLIEKIKEKQDKPFVICFVGINGAGKTTTIAKVANLLKKNNLSVVLSASDTFDAVSYAKAHKIDVVLIDTAGRQHSNKDLLREMEKIVRVAKPDLKLFVGEAITGNDCVEQSKEFHKVIGIDGIILSKADVDEKGGAIISTSYITHRPIIYLGIGQSLDDLKEFDVKELVSSLGL